MSGEISKNRIEIEAFETPNGMISLREPAEMLLEQMRKVKESPTHIEPTMAMCEIAERLTDMAKVQAVQAGILVDMLKANKQIGAI